MKAHHHVFRHRKSLSQNFLTCPRTLIEISSFIQNIFAKEKEKRCIEIGIGEGALTRILLEQGLYVQGFEVDPQLKNAIESLHQEWPQQFSYHFQSVLDYRPQGQEGACVGHIPYHLSSPILLWFLKYSHHFSFGLFLVQKEFAERVASTVNQKSYGRISIISQLHCKVKKLRTVHAAAFTPRPEVDSAYLFLKPDSSFEKTSISWSRFERFTHHLFMQRRKKLRNILRSVGVHDDDWPHLEAQGFNPHVRPETLAPHTVKNLFDIVEQKRLGYLEIKKSE